MKNATRRGALFGSATALLAPLALNACATARSAQTGLESGANIQFSTHQYASKEGQDLFFNLVYDASVSVPGRRPAIMFSFGGGWEGGDRGDQASTVSLFQDFLALGYAIVAIDYRLGIRIAKERSEFTPDTSTEMYLRAIQWGVEDLFDATSYVVAHADEWNIDVTQLVALGGSSGAINSLVAEYHVANATELARNHLPRGFRYAGVISMAGAFWLPANTPLRFASRPAPIMFFHGAADQLVTYDEVQAHFSGYGPVYFFRNFSGPDYPKWFVDYPGGDHVLAALPIMTRQLEIRAFLERMVRDKQELSIHTTEDPKIPATFAGLMQQRAAEEARSQNR